MDSDSKDPFLAPMPLPTAARPLLGLTVLVIEDSRFACEALRLLCLRSGARIRRADSLKSARRHLKIYRPSVAIIDLGLPDGSGADLIRELTTANPRPEVILGMSGDTNGEAIAMNAGADSFLPKPVVSLAHFQDVILRNLPVERRPTGPRVVPQEIVEPDPIAFRDDMAHAAEVIDSREDDQTLDYVVQFVSGVALSANDAPLSDAVQTLAARRTDGGATTDALATLSGLLRERLSQAHTI